MKCKYCGKECKNLNSLKQHEIRCKLNPNRIKVVNNTKNTGFKSGIKKWVYRNEEVKLVNIEEIDKYKALGWNLGYSDSFKSKISKGLIGKSVGKCLEPEKEKERIQKISNSMKGNKNWKFNKKHGNSKQGWYKGIHCDSTWELAFLVYHIDHNLKIEKCKEQRTYIYNESVHLYFPDFVTEEGIIEVKGRLDKKAIEKQKQNPDIIIYDKFKMKKYLEYVINKYGKDFYTKLYE